MVFKTLDLRQQVVIPEKQETNEVNPAVTGYSPGRGPQTGLLELRGQAGTPGSSRRQDLGGRVPQGCCPVQNRGGSLQGQAESPQEELQGMPQDPDRARTGSRCHPAAWEAPHVTPPVIFLRSRAKSALY